MIFFERLQFLAKGGKDSYKHKGKENKKTTELQDFLDKVYYSNPSYYKKYIS